LSLRVDERGLLIRLSDGKMAFFSTWCPKGTPLEALVEGRRWAIEDAFETAKTELAHNETRSWHGWHRHVSLVMLAFALLIRHKADTSPQKRPNSTSSGPMVTPGDPSCCLASSAATN